MSEIEDEPEEETAADQLIEPGSDVWAEAVTETVTEAEAEAETGGDYRAARTAAEPGTAEALSEPVLLEQPPTADAELVD